MTDLAERMADFQARNAESLSDDQAKERFLELLCDGVPIGKAGKVAGRSATWFRRRRNPAGANYDKAFTEEFDRITAPGGEYKSALADDAFTGMMEAAKSGNVRAQEKVLAAYAADFAFLRPQAATGTLNVEQLQVFFGELPLEKLLELQEARQSAKMKELPVIDL